jgi:plastocyanin
MRATKRGQVHPLGVRLLATVTLAATAIGCSGSSNHPVDAGGGSGGHAGQGGQGGRGGQAGGGGGQAGAGATLDGGARLDSGSDRLDAASGFMAFAPCASESAYVSNATQIAFGGTLGLNYSPACLRVVPGTTVTFSGDFATHPLTPSISRTTGAANPILSTGTGTTASFTFTTPGFYGYFCLQHGDDQGDAMAGMIWVQ